MKSCNNCGILKPLYDFYKRTNGRLYALCKKCYLDKYSPNRCKPNAGRFKKGIIPWNRSEVNGRNSVAAKEWKKNIIKRDDKCIHCGSIENLHAHHIKDWTRYPKLRFKLNNGLTLCNSCHAIEHGKKKCNLLKNGKPWHAGKKMSMEYREKLSNAHKGKTAWNKGKKMSLEYRKKCSESQTGKKHSEETKEKMRIAHLGKKYNKRILSGGNLTPA